MMLGLFAVVGCTLFGLLAGLLVFKVKTRWCATCGYPLGCLACAGRSQVSGAGHRPH
ncbi:hypothetical protein [Plantactinospora sonchi]|uniref:Uncharacterized protein n=1 Tax=Plantactinospora sonchi TaxID=1544735 RepID=A0ABU7RMN4_9ACTN